MKGIISTGQKEQAVRVISDAARKTAEAVIDELSEAGVINKDNFQNVITKGEQIVKVVGEVIRKKIAELAENIRGHLKRIFGEEKIVLDSTDGKEVLADANDVFNYIDGDFVSWKTNVGDSATPKTPVEVYEMVKDGTFADIFGGLGVDLDLLCLTQGQIKQFVRKYDRLLRTDGYATFFLFKVGSEFFVARVSRSSASRREVSVDQFAYDCVWFAESRHRFVIPQLALAS